MMDYQKCVLTATLYKTTYIYVLGVRKVTPDRLGKIRGIYLPFVLDELIEKTRNNLGMNRSRFIQYCVLKTLQELSIISEKAHASNEQLEIG